MRTMFCGVAVAVTMAACATNAFAQTDWKNYGLFQVGATTGAYAAAQDPQQPKLTLGADFGQAINRHVEIYLAGGWQDEVPAGFRDTFHFTSGVRLMPLRHTFVRPYVSAGAGMMHFRLPKPIDGKNRFLAEVGAGVAFQVGRQGYIDVGYHYFKPYEGPRDFTPNGVFAGFGFRY
jgi:opacity protein-like surface antigen